MVWPLHLDRGQKYKNNQPSRSMALHLGVADGGLSERVADEIAALEAICGDDFRAIGPKTVAIRVMSGALEVTFELPPGYPERAPPSASISDRRWSERLNDFIASSWRGEEMLFDVVNWAIDIGEEEEHERKTAVDESQTTPYPATSTAVVILDHMRDIKRYEKHLRLFVERTRVACRVLYSATGREAQRGVRYQNVIILIRGDALDLASFLKALRTKNVDCDASGKPCRERMLSVLELPDASSLPPVPKEAQASFGTKVVDLGGDREAAWRELANEVGIEGSAFLRLPDVQPQGVPRGGGAAEKRNTATSPSSGPRQFTVHVQPNCSHPDVEAGGGEKSGAGASLEGEVLTVRLVSPLVDGKANKELVSALSRHFKVPRSCVVIVRGKYSREKIVQIG